MYFDNILYMHGFASSLSTPKALAISEWCEKHGIKFVGVTYTTNENANVVYHEINDQVSKYASTYSLIIGHSLGGFWANYFGRLYSLPVILLNPSLEPHKTLKKYVEYAVKGIWVKSEDVLYSYAKYETQYPLTQPNPAGKWVFVANDDEILSHQTTMLALEPVSECHVVDGGKHTFSNLDPVFDQLEMLVNYGIESVE